MDDDREVDRTDEWDAFSRNRCLGLTITAVTITKFHSNQSHENSDASCPLQGQLVLTLILGLRFATSAAPCVALIIVLKITAIWCSDVASFSLRCTPKTTRSTSILYHALVPVCPKKGSDKCRWTMTSYDDAAPALPYT